jgi:hypothetical protein
LLDQHPEYWRVKAAELEFQLAQQTLRSQLQQQMQEEFTKRFEAQLKPLLEKRAAVMREAGLDAAKNWSLVDATQTITEMP